MKLFCPTMKRFSTASIEFWNRFAIGVCDSRREAPAKMIKLTLNFHLKPLGVIGAEKSNIKTFNKQN